ncbi:RDD family protein [Alkalihalobacillus pseudalcaliphilus]|uniref:RDD family protein n=1 Tax=Alkalihalobacillus pseudalcaliphilus TaxID=79884 RepID=UPI00064E008F|nr:RDD family protein [Alkalihalobacillus pseudalcaliphilus]KMK75471.1 RDD domain-containing protein [Alkalihalobacillus pseudalcaliphilus]
MNASFLLRFKAFMIDYILILIYLVVLFISNVFLFPSLQNFFTGSLIIAQFTGFLMVTFPVSLYFIISDSRIGKQSFGKRKTGIRVVGYNGEALSVLHLTFRTFLKFLPWELSHFLMYRLIYIGDGVVPFTYYLLGILIYALIFAYILPVIFTKKKQSLYDIVAKTNVVKI